VRLTVVFCLFNEEQLVFRLAELVRRIRAVLPGHEVTFVAVDDGSTDKTAAALASLEGIDIRTHEHNLGFGAALNSGLRAAQGDAALVYDPDEAYAV